MGRRRPVRESSGRPPPTRGAPPRRRASGGEEGVEDRCRQALPDGAGEPGPEEIRELLAQAGRFRPPAQEEGRPGWVRLVLPLKVQGRTIGAWLIGRRDPDDFFPVADVHLLSTVANQIAPMLENIRLYERAQEEIAQRTAAEEASRGGGERRLRAL